MVRGYGQGSENHLLCELVHRSLLAGMADLRDAGGIRRERAGGPMFAPTILDSGTSDVYGVLLLGYFVLLLGCAIYFARRIGAFSRRRRRQRVADETLSDSSLL
jgi:hypothetical protein